MDSAGMLEFKQTAKRHFESDGASHRATESCQKARACCREEKLPVRRKRQVEGNLRGRNETVW